jgi:hypothetical protein
VHRLRPERRGGVRSTCAHEPRNGASWPERRTGLVWSGSRKRVLVANPSCAVVAVLCRNAAGRSHAGHASEAGANARRKAAAKSLVCNFGRVRLRRNRLYSRGKGRAHRAPAIPKGGCRVSALRVTIRRARKNSPPRRGSRSRVPPKWRRLGKRASGRGGAAFSGRGIRCCRSSA